MAELKTFNGTGADASGSDGDSNRVLTLTNTGLTIQGGFLVYASGLPLALSVEYTVVHSAPSTQITFLNGLWDNMTVIVNYYENDLPGVANDFINGPLADFGVTVVRTPVTKNTGFSGNKEYTDGVDENIEVVFHPYKKDYKLDSSGLDKVYDAIIFTRPDATLNKYDKITYDSKKYRVDNVSPRDFDGTRLFRRAELFFIEDA